MHRGGKTAEKAVDARVLIVDANTLFDRDILSARRSRAKEKGLFLHDIAIELVRERLEEVNKSFTKSAIVSWQPKRWSAALDLSAFHLAASEELNFQGQLDFDLIIHAMELHHMNDPVGQLIQMRRALAPDGIMIAVCFGARTLSNLRAALTQAEVATSGGISPRMAPLGDLRDLGNLLQRSGFALPVADNFIQSVSYPSLNALLHDLRDMAETNVLSARPKHFSKRALFEELDAIMFQSTPTTVEFELAFLTGWAPHPSQQKPLKPGSATHALETALAKAKQNGSVS